MLLSVAVPSEDRLVIPTDGGNVMALRLEGATFGNWNCEGQLDTAYRDLGHGMVVQLSPAEVDLYAGRYSFEAYRESLARDAREFTEVR